MSCDLIYSNDVISGKKPLKRTGVKNHHKCARLQKKWHLDDAEIMRTNQLSSAVNDHKIPFKLVMY